MKAVILAAGVGTRLLPLTETIPKTLIRINGVPIIDKVLESLPDEIDEIIIVVDYLKEKIKDHTGDNFKDKKIIFTEQGESKGTLAALQSAKYLFSENERFLVLNGDDIHDKEELMSYLLYPRSFGVQKMIMPNYYSVKLGKKNHIEGFTAQSEEEKRNGALIATGAYVIDSNIFKHPGVMVFGGEYGLPQTILAQKEETPIVGIVTEKWIPINYASDIEKAEKMLE